MSKNLRRSPPVSGLLWVSLIILGLTACGDAPTQQAPLVTVTSSPVESEETVQLTVYVTNYPLQYFAERIAQNTVTVKSLIPPDIDPAFWQPTAQDIAQMQTGDLIFINGATYEKWLNTVSLPEAKLINTSVSFQDHYLPDEEKTVHRHGPEGEHEHTGTAFTTWLDFQQAIAQADAIREALSQRRPDLAPQFQTNFDVLKQELTAIDQQLIEIMANQSQIPFIASHPVYQYFANAYGLNLKSLHWEPDEVPTEIQWQELQQLLQSHPAKWMIWEDQPNPETVAKLKTVNINILVFRPLGNRSGSEDFMSSMNKNTISLEQIN